MNRSLCFLFSALLMAAGCEKMNHQEEGMYSRAFDSEIVFGINSAKTESQTKATYAGIDEEDGGKYYERIDWNINDLLYLTCAQADGSTGFSYNVTEITPSGRYSNASITHSEGETGLRWKDNGTYHFYALTPSNNLTTTGVAICELPDVQIQGEESDWDGDTFVAQANSEYMIMTAQNTVIKSSEEDGPAVNLPFVMNPTVIEFTLCSEEDMVVNSVSLESTAEITGRFELALTGKDEGEFPDYIKKDNLSNTVTMYPTIEEEPAAIPVGKNLRFTFFMLPKDITNLKFKITVVKDSKLLTISSKLKYAADVNGGAFLTLPAHTKTRIRGFVVPEGIDWLVIKENGVEERINNEAGTIMF